MMSDHHSAPLQLHLLGPPEVRVGDTMLTFPTRKTLALLVYLAVEGGPQPREHLAALLWPESDQERSYASLRNTLSHLKSALSPTYDQLETGYLSITYQTLALNPDADIRIDLHTVERAYAQARADRSNREKPKKTANVPLLQKAAATYRDDFLTGFSLGDAPEFDLWVSIQSEVWRRRLGLILDRLSELQYASGNFAATTEVASLWSALDTMNEAAYRRKMRAHFAAGERGQALDTYDACRSILVAELGIEPGPDTKALAARIRTQRPARRTMRQPEPDPDTSVSFLGHLFAGRTLEHQTLAMHYGYASASRPQVVVLRGEAGIGKTRLAKTFLTWGISRGADVLQGRAFESGSRMSYHPLIAALRLLLEQEEIPADKLDATWLAPLSHLLPELRERYADLPDRYLEVDGGRTELFEALVQLTLISSRQSPLFLFIDDLQWADSATLDWLVYAARRWQESEARILLLVSLRSAALQPPIQSQQSDLVEWLAQMGREIDLTHLELGALSEEDTIQLMLSILAPPDADFAQWMFNETGGHPFYLMETLKDLLERGVLHPKQIGKGQWGFEVDAEHDLGRSIRVPSTVRTVIRSRLSRLSPNAFSLLAAGAVLESGLTFERLCAISGMTENTGLPALDELVSSQLLLEVAQAGAASIYTFTHNMIRDVVYTEAGDARRRLFHRRALDLLEASGESSAVLAHHALTAGLPEAAFHHSLAAGQEALRLSAASEAQAHLEKALQLAKDELLGSVEVQSQIRNLYLHLAQAYELSGQPQQAQSTYDELQRLSPN
jgi:DNA-binding SARP family transcriptional activator